MNMSAYKTPILVRLARLVDQTRQAQKKYFKTRSAYDLGQAKDLERKLDQAISDAQSFLADEILGWVGVAQVTFATVPVGWEITVREDRCLYLVPMLMLGKVPEEIDSDVRFQVYRLGEIA